MKSFLNLGCLAFIAAALTLTARAQSDAKPKLGVSLDMTGIALEHVTNGSAAAVAGLHSGDFLMSWGDMPMVDIDSVLHARDAAAPGAPTTFTIRRGDKILNLKHTWPKAFPEKGLTLGVTVGVGVCVAKVYDDSPAKKAGIQAGDILTGFDTEVIEDYDDLKRLLAGARPGSTQLLTLRRGAAEKAVKVRFPRPARTGMERRPPQSGGNVGEMKRRLEELMGHEALKGLQKGEMPFGMKDLQGFQVPGMSMFKNLGGLDTVKTDIDKSIEELVKLNNPALKTTIARLRKSSAKLAEATKGMQGMRKMANSFMGEFAPFGMEEMLMEEPEPEEIIEDREMFDEEIEEEEPEPEELIELEFKKAPKKKSIQQRIQELVESGITDLDKLNKIIKKEFPSVKVHIATSTAELEEFEESDDFGKKPRIRPPSRPAPKATSRPVQRGARVPVKRPTSKPTTRRSK